VDTAFNLEASMRVVVTAGLLALTSMPAPAQTPPERPPVIDVHMHAPLAPGPVDSTLPRIRARLRMLDSLNVRRVVLNGVPDILYAWHREIGDRAIPSLLFPCENGLAANFGRPCFPDGAEYPDLAQLRRDIAAGRVQALGEIALQYLGIGPSDPVFEPYLALAEETDIPVFIHMGLGPPNSAYEVNPFPVKAPNFRAAAGNPLLLEDALVRHPKLRIAVMHAGWPMLDEMLYVLYQHPQVYAEIGLLHHAPFVPRAEFYAYLRRLVDAGFGQRILFGSDSPIGTGIDAVLEADFLSDQQKRDILCNNAARFLRLDEATCR
jgi:hypothetical protein